MKQETRPGMTLTIWDRTPMTQLIFVRSHFRAKKYSSAQLRTPRTAYTIFFCHYSYFQPLNNSIENQVQCMRNTQQEKLDSCVNVMDLDLSQITLNYVNISKNGNDLIVYTTTEIKNGISYKSNLNK